MPIARIILLHIVAIMATLAGQAKDTLSLEAMMHVRKIESPILSANGRWLAYAATPDRGDGDCRIREVRTERTITVERGAKPVFSRDGQWAGVTQRPPFVAMENAGKDKPKQGFALVRLAGATIEMRDSIKSFAFSEDSRWLALQHFKRDRRNGDSENEDESNKEGEITEANTDEGDKTEPRFENAGSRLTLRELASGRERVIDFVTEFAFDSTGSYLAYALADTNGRNNALYVLTLTEPDVPARRIQSAPYEHYAQLSWNNSRGLLAFLSAVEDEEEQFGDAALRLWSASGDTRLVMAADAAPDAWLLPFENSLRWTEDGERLFFGFKTAARVHAERRLQRQKNEDDADKDSTALFDVGALAGEAGLDVWHWRDSLIIPNQIKQWKNNDKAIYRAVYHLAKDEIVPLAGPMMAELQAVKNSRYALGLADGPYRREITWNGWFDDLYLVDLHSGRRSLIAARLRSASAQVSPGGAFAVYYQDSLWYLYECSTGRRRAVNAEIATPFYNEDFDYPRTAPAYGVAGWTADDDGVLIYDKFDIWYFPTHGTGARRITENGREQRLVFRIQKVDPRRRWFDPDERLLLSGYHDSLKHSSFYECRIKTGGPRLLLEEKRRFRFLAKAEDADLFLFSKESFREFPDLWIAGPDFSRPRRLTDVNPQLAQYRWGSAELYEWKSQDGRPLQGVLVKPDDYDPAKRYPLIVYFYRFYSQRLYEFDRPRIHDRFKLPYYASHGYCVFMPDIRFDIGAPGQSAVKCILPGVQQLVAEGVADPDKLGIHGHSWSGYQTAYVISQSNIFDAAIAGAPVSNMTSAYSGIRWGSGLARQFQYERFQSRIGGSLWEYPLRYLENSPVFYADRISTPLLIMFGDDDGAVPWYQGIELYLALRRHDKDCIFLQYHGEPHHLKKYPNKVDYDIRMKQYFDHYLKKLPPADWIVRGEPYWGE